MIRPLAVLVLAVSGVASAADPVVVRLSAKATVPTNVVTLGQIAKLSGGDAETLARLKALDLAERTKKQPLPTVTRSQVEFRLKLAGFDDVAVVSGAEVVTIAFDRKTVPTADVVAAAKTALLAKLPHKPGELTVELLQPVTVTTPEVAADDTVTITAEPHGAPKVGRVQMNASVAVNGDKALAVPVFFEVKSTKTDPVLVTSKQRVTVTVTTPGLTLRTVGEALQDGRHGQQVRVMNVDSKKVVVGRVTAAGVVEVDAGGAP